MSSRNDTSGWRQALQTATTPPLSLYLGGRLLATQATWIFRVAAGWAVWDITRSPALLGIATMALLAPQVLLALWAGVLADRSELRWLLGWTHALAGCTMALAAICAGLGWLNFQLLVVSMLIVGTMNALSMSAAKVMVSSVAPASQTLRAVSLNSVIFNTGGFLGPALAGLAIAVSGLTAAFTLAAAFKFAYLCTLPSLPRVWGKADRKHKPLRQIREGIEYAMSDPLIRLLLALHVASATLARPFLEFIPALVSQLLNGGATQAASVSSAAGLGAVIGGMWLAQRDPRLNPLPIVLAAMGSLAVCLVALAWSRSLILTIGLAFMAGIFMVTRAAAMQTMIQTAARPVMRGRAISLYGLVLNAGAMLGALMIGFAAQVLGISWALTMCALLALVVWLILNKPLKHQAGVHPFFNMKDSDAS